MRSPIFMTSKLVKLLLPSLAAFLLTSCENEKETIEVESPQSYLRPLQPGKFITYKLDSTVFLQAGRVEETHSYQEKHIVDAVITDNLGRTSYKIYRYLRDAANMPWRPAGTYVMTPLTNTVEVIEDNMRVVVLAGPIREGQSWRGNQYLASEPYSYLYNFSNDNNMGDWNFTIESLGQTETINDQKINDVLTVRRVEDELTNVPIRDKSAFASKTVSVDKFAKGIGLVYQQHILWEYQPSTGPSSTAYYVGFGVTRSLLEHN